MMKLKHTLLEYLKDYCNSDAYPFHMPGHKRQTGKGMSFPNPFQIDITEIDGFDNLHHPNGILKESMEWASSIYHTKMTYYLVNGSSCGLLAAISAATTPGGSILVSRNCHKSVYHGVFLNQLKTYYTYPQNMRDIHLQGGLSAEDIEVLLKTHPDIQAVLIVSPTYEGVVSDVASIAAVVHAAGLPLIVDEAHGAHFPFGEDEGIFPKSALSCGADLVIQSVHKTLPSLTQTALIHINSDRVLPKQLEFYLQIFQSSSPSYLFMASIENSIRYMMEEGRDRMAVFADELRKTRKKLMDLKHLQLLDQSIMDVYDYDCSKIVISTAKISGFTGEMLSQKLRSYDHLEMEMSGADYVVAISTLMDTSEGLKRLTNALFDIDNSLNENNGIADSRGHDLILSRPDIEMTISKAVRSEQEPVKIDHCAGRVSAEFVYVYPPGIPIITPGERFSAQILKQILDYKQQGYPVQGMSDERAEEILCVKSIM